MRVAKRLIPWLAVCLPISAFSQIDPVRRDLIQFGYNQPLEGKEPVAAYAFYYHNQPDFIHTNLTLRVALAPVYLDSELGFVHGIGPQTDFGIGLAGGGFADSYNEFDFGKWNELESFDGHGAELSGSIYHLFNPEDMIPLNLVIKGAAHYTVYEQNDDTDPNFHQPDDGGIFSIRSGLRYGGVEPTLFPDLAMELAVWYQGQYRTDYGNYGYSSDPFYAHQWTHLFWASAALDYTLPKSHQSFGVRVIGGTSIDVDRLSAYRLGGYLPLAAEYPLSLPGYFFQEFTAKQFVLINASYTVPITRDEQWGILFNGATAGIDYVNGAGEPGDWVSGVGAGIMFRSHDDRFKVVVGYAYGIDAIRDDTRGASSISVLLQFDLGKEIKKDFDPAEPGRWRGWGWIFGR